MAAHEQKISLLSQELERMAMQLKTRNDEIYTLNQKITVTESNSSQITIINAEKGRLEQELQASRN